MIHLVKQFLQTQSKNLTDEQKEKIMQKSRKLILEKYPSVRELEFTA